MVSRQAGRGLHAVSGDPVHVDAVTPERLAEELDQHGVVRLKGVIDQDWLAGMRAFVADAIAANGDGDFYLDHADADVDSPAHRLAAAPALRQLLAATTTLRRPQAGTTKGSAMRCSMLVRAGKGRKAPSNMFHYDPCVLTMIVPIFIPQGPFGSCGELAALRNTRPFRRFHAAHLLETLLTHNALYRRHVTRKVHADPEEYVVPLQPGDAYLFWGYRTFHGNLDCAPGLLRTTLVLKCGQVHSGSAWTTRLAWTFSRSRRDLRRFGYRPPRASAAPRVDLAS